jgi:hypothetical protein
MSERRFDNPSRCGWCGSKGQHLPDCDNPALARAASQERPQPLDPNAMTPIEELDDMREWAQERPSIDVERLARPQ